MEIVECTPNRSFTDCTYLFGAKMYDEHMFEETERGLQITTTVRVDGILAWLWVQLVAKNVAKDLQGDIEKQVVLASKL